jgi:hypothetical protein
MSALGCNRTHSDRFFEPLETNQSPSDAAKHFGKKPRFLQKRTRGSMEIRKMKIRWYSLLGIALGALWVGMLAPLVANAQVTIKHVRVTEKPTTGQGVTVSYCDKNGTACDLPIWDLGAAGVFLLPGQTLVLTQNGTFTNSNVSPPATFPDFDTSDRINPGSLPSMTCYFAQVTFPSGETGGPCTVSVELDTGTASGLTTVFTDSKGNPLDNFNQDTGDSLHTEQSPFVLAAIGPTYTLSLGYPDNVHGCASNCLPSPWDKSSPNPATVFIGAGVGPTGTCTAAPCYDGGALLITASPANQKTLSIGPSSMEGAIRISNGDWVNGGYSFQFKSGSHIATQYTVDATVTITGPCSNGGSDTVIIPLGAPTYSVPAGNTDWLPTGDQNSVLSWQGSVQVGVTSKQICGGTGKLDASKGAIYTATATQNPPTGSLVAFRFKYRDPAAKGKPNTNCLDTNDPNRARADVCGASWSQTVTDP